MLHYEVPYSGGKEDTISPHPTPLCALGTSTNLTCPLCLLLNWSLATLLASSLKMSKLNLIFLLRVPIALGSNFSLDRVDPRDPKSWRPWEQVLRLSHNVTGATR